MENSTTLALATGQHLTSRHNDPVSEPADRVVSDPADRHSTRIQSSTARAILNDQAYAELREDKGKNCERQRPEEEDRHRHSNMVNVSPSIFGKTVTPFLKEHIPSHYAPIGKGEKEDATSEVNHNSRYCYRHRPDSKCRKAADETKMIVLQSELDKLPPADKQAITHVWSLFSAAPSRHRELMLQGLLTQCCFPQLSTVAREVQDQLKIDFITALPTELSLKILCYLDTVSLCKASQVSHSWRALADDDSVWVRMCEQHIDRKCTKCGWGLPKMDRKRLREYTQRRDANSTSPGNSGVMSMSPRLTALSLPTKRSASPDVEPRSIKRRCPDSRSTEAEQRLMPWKSVYRARWEIGSNWKYGRCSLRIYRDHTNGVTCLQIYDDILATGSYDGTIIIRNLTTNEIVQTLHGHTRGIRSLQLDDTKLISGALDSTMKVWNWHTGECLSTLQGHQDGVISVNFDGTLLASGSMDKTVKIFKFNTQETFCLRGHQDWVNSVRVDAASRTVLSASDDTLVKLWDLDTKTCIRTMRGHVGHVQQVLALPDSYTPCEESLAADGSTDNTDTASVSSGRSIPAFVTEPDGDLRSMYGPSFVNDPSRPLPPRYILTGALDSTIRLWDTASGKCLKTLFGHVEGVWGLATDSLRVLSSAQDGMVKVWDPRSGTCERTFTGHRGPVTCVGLSDFRMASGSEDGEVRLYSFQDGTSMDVRTPR